MDALLHMLLKQMCVCWRWFIVHHIMNRPVRGINAMNQPDAELWGWGLCFFFQSALNNMRLQQRWFDFYIL